MELIHQESSNSIRQMPENYLIAHKVGANWVCEPDLAANQDLCVKVFKELFNHSSKWGSGNNLIQELNKTCVKLYDKYFEVLAIAYSVKEANDLMEANKSYSLLCIRGNRHYLADFQDFGSKNPL